MTRSSMRELRIVDDRGRRVTGFGTKVFRELTGGRYVTLGRSDLSRLLFDKAKGGTEIIFGDEILGLDARPDGVQVQFKHAGERRFALVIGADGLRSELRRLAFGPDHQFEKRLGYSVAAFEVDHDRPRVIEEGAVPFYFWQETASSAPCSRARCRRR